MFIQTRGAGPYKFGDVPVYAFPVESLDVWSMTPTGTVKLPPPMAETITDADGKFRLSVPKGKPFFLFAQAQRLMADGTTERFEWRAPSTEIKHFNQVNLSSDWRFPRRPVEIEKRE